MMRTLFLVALVGGAAAGLVIVDPVGVAAAQDSFPGFAAPAGSGKLSQVITNLRNWLVGLLVALATLFLTIGGLLYLTANGDLHQTEKAKSAFKSAVLGYGLAALSPILVSALQSIVGV